MDVAIEQSWGEFLKEEFDKNYFKEIMKFVELEYTNNPGSIFPKKNELFRAFDSCPLQNVKVVILGQDPYPTKGHAHGLCFSVESDVRPIPKSLKNIYKEIESDLLVKTPADGNLLRWTEQGVLLLNAVLTVREGDAGSHSGKGWEKFTDAVIDKLNKEKTGIVYMLWGSKAQEKAEKLNAEDNYILKAPHPSPLSAYRGFFGCKHFSKANHYIQEVGKSKIEW